MESTPPSQDGRYAVLVRRAAEAFAGLPTRVAIPTRVRRPRRPVPERAAADFTLGAVAEAACAGLQDALGVDRESVLLAAWALAVARRAGTTGLIVGVATGAVASCGRRQDGRRLLPVACRTGGDRTVREYLRDSALALGGAAGWSDVALPDLARALGATDDGSRHPLTQIAFCDEDSIALAAEHDTALRTGPRGCGLAVEYNPSVLDGQEAALLAGALDRALTELFGSLDRPLSEVRTMTAAQREQLRSMSLGGTVDVSADLWQLIEAQARRDPDAVALRDADGVREMGYGELLTAVEAQAAELAAAGVGPGDRLGLAVRRSVRELVAVLAVLRQGAVWVALEPDVPPALARRMLDAAGATAVLGDTGRLAALGSALGRHAALPLLDQGTPPARAVPPPARLNGSAPVCVVFTAAGGNRAEGVAITRSSVLRLARDPQYLRPAATRRFLRVTPLASEAALPEIFAPLLAGGGVDVFPTGPVTPDGLMEFLAERPVTGLGLTVDVFRRIADYRPQSFAGIEQVIIRGGRVPGAQAARVLRACPRLRVTAGHGPAENGGLTVAHHIDDAAAATDPVPIGRPVRGAGVLVLDSEARLVPPGGIGELYVHATGMADGYIAGSGASAARFGRFSPDSDHVLFRTGDFVRLDATGSLHLLGRRDGRVEVRGRPVEPDLVADVLRRHPRVRDVAVVKTSGDHLLAAVAGPDDPQLPEALRVFATERLPGEAVPSSFVLMEELPRRADGGVDLGRLARSAATATGTRVAVATGPTAPGAASAPPPRARQKAGGGDPGDGLERTVSAAWQEALGTDAFGPHDLFLDIGGTSVHMLRLRAGLRRRLPDVKVTVQDLYRHQTVTGLAAYLRSQTGRQKTDGRVPRT